MTRFIHVLTQNLRAAPCAQVYEEATHQPVQDVLVRLSRPAARPGAGELAMTTGQGIQGRCPHSQHRPE